jgi:peptidoglycan hydrolase-like protein with peptidoglycan-binding domain
MSARIWWIGILWLGACGSTPTATGTTTDYVYVQQGRRVWPVQDQALVRSLEAQLQSQGFDPGPVDGVFDQRSAQALSAFQEAQGLPANGVLDSSTARALGLDWSRVRGDVRSARLEPF